MARTSLQAAIDEVAARDPVLARVVARVGPITHRPRDPDGPFGALVRAIVYQQLAGRAAQAIHGRLRATVGETVTPETLAATPDSALRAAGLSANKLASLRDLSAKVGDGTVVLTRTSGRSDEELTARLESVRGVGRWTAEMYLMSSCDASTSGPSTTSASAKATPSPGNSTQATPTKQGGRMPTNLPDVILRYFERDTDRDIDSIVNLFADDATVIDEGEERHGTAEIRSWQTGAASRYTYTTEITSAEALGPDRYVVTGRLTGNFPGGTADLTWDFTIAGQHITRLTIAP